MIAKLDTADAQETAAFTELNACTGGLTCASSSATSLDEAMACSEKLFVGVRNCTQTMLEYYW